MCVCVYGINRAHYESHQLMKRDESYIVCKVGKDGRGGGDRNTCKYGVGGRGTQVRS